MESVEELIATEQIRQQKARYCRYLDTKQFDEWEALFKPDAHIAFYNPDASVLGEYNNIAELAPLARKVFGARQTAHQLHNSEIEFTSETTATAIWSMADCQIHPAKGDEPEKTELAY